ncbi:hypothetical protein WMY93_030455 [Mugilogobius chulae]|uniref:Synaptonemal complex protein 2 n=1 Tax=Mugilogobius chulae TaxID=88201 RepID=A0AAW0MPB0_9GOBI
MRLSESTTYISSSGGECARSVSTVLQAAKCKGKPSLELVCSAERPGQKCFGDLRTAVKTSFNTTPDSRREGVTPQNKPLLKTRTTVLSAPSEVDPLMDSTFVPDSQPTTARNIASKWHKYSVTEMLMMPTQKMCSLPISGSPASSVQRQMCPSSVQRTSAPSSGPVIPKQLHAELTQRLQQVLHETNQAASPEIVPVQKRKISKTENANINKDPKIKSTAYDSAASDLKEKKPQRNSRTKGKRDAEITGKMVKHISSHYEVNSLIKVKGHKISQCLIPPLIDRPFFNMKWHTSMGNVTTLVNSSNKSKTTSTKKSKDVFAFSVDTPQSIGMNKAITSSTCISVSDEESRLPSTKKNKQPPPKAKRYVKKHLFSDTDTDRGTTDVSWLKESSRKPKPKVIKYPKAAPSKTKVAPALPSCNSPELQAPSPTPLKAVTNVKSTKDLKKPQHKKEKIAPARKEVPAATRRPSRAAAHVPKNYKEINSDGSQSESEIFKVDKSEKTNLIQEMNKKSKLQSKEYVEAERNNSSQSDSEVEQPAFTKPKYETNEDKKSNLKSELTASKKISKENLNHTDLKKACKKPPKPVNVLQESVEKPKKSTTKNGAPVKEQCNALKETWAQRQVMSSPLSFIERMRSAERLGPSLGLPCSPVVSLQASPLTISPNPYVPNPLTPTLLLSKPPSTVPSAGDLKSASRTQSIKSVASLASLRGHGKCCAAIRASAIQSPVLQDISSPPQSPLSLSRPLMTSTQVNQARVGLPSMLPSPLPETHSSSKMSPVSEASISRGSIKSSVSSKVMDRVSAALRAEETPQMDISLKSPEDVVSGPNRKRHMSYSSSNNSDEEDKEQIKKSKMRTQQSPRLKPRKLFKSATKAQDLTESWEEQSTDKTRRVNRLKVANNQKPEEENACPVKKKRSETYIHDDTVLAEGRVSQLLSSSHTVISGQWDADVEDGDVDDDLDTPGLNPRDMCREFSCKLKQKFKGRFKMVEVYNKQSLKTVQQHISAVSSEVAKHRFVTVNISYLFSVTLLSFRFVLRAQGLEKVQRVLLEEIHKLEQDDTVLKNMENDLTIHWNKQTVAFRSLQKQEKRRNEVLRKTLQNNACHSLEYEERVFTSQMCLIKKDMKSAQDRLLSDMHEGEMQSVKRGLHALFFPDATRF